MLLGLQMYREVHATMHLQDLLDPRKTGPLHPENTITKTMHYAVEIYDNTFIARGGMVI